MEGKPITASPIHGVGKWKYNGDETVEGEWKDGRLHGYIVQTNQTGYFEYEAKDDGYNGKYIRYFKDGRRW